MPSLPSVAAFVVKSLLAVSISQLANTAEGSSLKSSCAWHSGPYIKIWVDETEGTTEGSTDHFHIVHTTPTLLL